MTAPRRRWRSTIRVRLTLLYAGAFFLAGAVLVVLMYLFLRQVLDHQAGPAGALHHLTPDIQGAFRAQYQRDRDTTLDTMLVASLIMLGAVGIAAAGFGWLLAGRALYPLQQITATARRVADRSLHERIALDGPDDEIKDLADTLDSMLERLDRAFDSQHRFVANASHELRTPLTINRTLIEVALAGPQANEAMRQLGATLLAVNERHERLIDGLLTLASSEQRIAEPTRVDIADIARHVTKESAATARSAGVDVRSSPTRCRACSNRSGVCRLPSGSPTRAMPRSAGGPGSACRLCGPSPARTAETCTSRRGRTAASRSGCDCPRRPVAKGPEPVRAEGRTRRGWPPRAGAPQPRSAVTVRPRYSRTGLAPSDPVRGPIADLELRSLASLVSRRQDARRAAAARPSAGRRPGRPGWPAPTGLR